MPAVQSEEFPYSSCDFAMYTYLKTADFISFPVVLKDNQGYISTTEWREKAVVVSAT